MKKEVFNIIDRELKIINLAKKDSSMLVLVTTTGSRKIYYPDSYNTWEQFDKNENLQLVKEKSKLITDYCLLE